MQFEPIIQQQQQVSREELARSKQAITELQHHYNSYEAQLRLLQSNMKTEEDSIKYASLMLELNRCRDNLNRHINAYNELVQLANVEFPTNRLSEQAKKEIYHFYHSGRYNQNQLASQYGVQQSTISKIVNGSQPS
jgi:chromosome segregation ATPase